MRWALEESRFNSRKEQYIFDFPTAFTLWLTPRPRSPLYNGCQESGRESDHCRGRYAWSYTSAPRYALMAWQLIIEAQKQLYIVQLTPLPFGFRGVLLHVEQHGAHEQ